MINVLQNKSDKFEWIDLTDPTTGELQQIAQQYELHPASVQDCLQPEHLPKCEEFENNIFIITACMIRMLLQMQIRYKRSPIS
jgi:magnesium transporter